VGQPRLQSFLALVRSAVMLMVLVQAGSVAPVGMCYPSVETFPLRNALDECILRTATVVPKSAMLIQGAARVPGDTPGPFLHAIRAAAALREAKSRAYVVGLYGPAALRLLQDTEE
jgi:hypothetical protein